MKTLFVCISIFVMVSTLSLRATENSADNEKPVVAILDLHAVGLDETLAKAIQENFTTRLITENVFQIVERTRLESVMSELNLVNSDDFSDSSAITIGNLLGANMILVGSVTKLGTTFTINIRGIEIKTGKAVIAHSVEVESESELSKAVTRLALMFSTPDTVDTTIVSNDTTRKTKKEKKGDKKKTDEEKLDKEKADKKKTDEEKLDKEKADKKKAEEEKLDKEKADKIKADEEKADEKKIVLKTPPLKQKLTPLNIAGISLIGSGAAIAVSGIALIIVDGTVMAQRVENASSYSEYQKLLLQDQIMGITGISLAALGGSLIVAGIPMSIYKKKNLSFQIGVGHDMSLALCYRF